MTRWYIVYEYQSNLRIIFVTMQCSKRVTIDFQRYCEFISNLFHDTLDAIHTNTLNTHIGVKINIYTILIYSLYILFHQT